MSQELPVHIESDSPDQLIFLLESLISSPLCPYHKQWICYSYLHHHHSMVSYQLNIVPIMFEISQGIVQYRGTMGSMILNITDLVSYIGRIRHPLRRIMSPEQVQLWKLTAKKSTFQRACSSISEGLLEEASWFASWFALQGEFTLGDFAKGRSFVEFIEMHWCRVLSQSKPCSPDKHEQKSRYCDSKCHRCQCPGHELASLVASDPLASLDGNTAEVVMEEILSHVDPRILLFMGPELRQFEDFSRHTSKKGLEAWYTPHSPVGRWRRVSGFSALAAIADRLVGAFGRIKNHPRIISIAWAQLDQDIESLASKITKK